MFPELFEDFSKAVPVPNYTRRDGVLNIASHFPTGVMAPDLGNFVLDDQTDQYSWHR